MIDILLVDFSAKSILPETLIYTAGHLGSTGTTTPSAWKVSSPADLAELLKSGLDNCRRDVVVLLWQQVWLSSRGGFMMLECADKIKLHLPKATVVAAGYLPTMSPRLFLEQQSLDTVLRGYPWAHQEGDLAAALREHDIIECSHPPDFPETLSLEKGMPYLANPETCFKRSPDNKVMTSYFTNFHCNNGCPFCFNSAFLACGGAIIKSRKTIESDLEFLVKKHQTELIQSEDNNFFVDGARGEDNLRYIAQHPRLSLAGNVDIMVRDVTAKRLELISAAGAHKVFFGLESLSEQQRKGIAKEFSLQQLETMLEFGQRSDCFFFGNVLLGVGNTGKSPLSSRDVERERQRVLAVLARHRNISIEMRLFMPLLGTPFGDRIWAETGSTDNITLPVYFEMIDRLVHSKLYPERLPLPSCFESHLTINHAATVSRALRTVNLWRTQADQARRKGWRFLLRAADIRATLGRHLLRLRLYRLIERLDRFCSLLRGRA